MSLASLQRFNARQAGYQRRRDLISAGLLIVSNITIIAKIPTFSFGQLMALSVTWTITIILVICHLVAPVSFSKIRTPYIFTARILCTIVEQTFDAVILLHWLQRPAKPGFYGGLNDLISILLGVRVLPQAAVSIAFNVPVSWHCAKIVAITWLVTMDVGDYCKAPLFIDPVSQNRMNFLSHFLNYFTLPGLEVIGIKSDQILEGHSACIAVLYDVCFIVLMTLTTIVIVGNEYSISQLKKKSGLVEAKPSGFESFMFWLCYRQRNIVVWYYIMCFYWKLACLLATLK